MSIKNQRNLRAGAYGDPANIPYSVWSTLYGYDEQSNTSVLSGTGYTKEWMTCDQRLQRFFMASCSEKWEHDIAVSLGWRVYEITDELREGQIECPEQSRGIQCDDCLLCGGTSKQAKNIAIRAIGNKKVCYVEVGKSVNSIWNSWNRGNVPSVSPEMIGEYMQGKTANAYTSAEVWSGPSPVDGQPIMLLITGLSRAASRQSDNKKTGKMVQSYILKQNEKPTDAIKNGGDESICGKCPLRPYLVKTALAEVA